MSFRCYIATVDLIVGQLFRMFTWNSPHRPHSSILNKRRESEMWGGSEVVKINWNSFPWDISFSVSDQFNGFFQIFFNPFLQSMLFCTMVNQQIFLFLTWESWKFYILIISVASISDIRYFWGFFLFLISFS